MLKKFFVSLLVVSFVLFPLGLSNGFDTYADALDENSVDNAEGEKGKSIDATGVKISEINVLIAFDKSPGKSERALVESYGGNVKRTFGIVNAVSATIPEQAIAMMLNNPHIYAVELDKEIHVSDIEVDNVWGISQIEADQVHPMYTGAGVNVAILDSGIDYNHPELSDNYKGGYDFVNNDSYPYDDCGHGTHVAGTIAASDNGFGVVGVAPNANIYALKILDADGNGNFSDVIAALDWCVTHNIQVTNNSYGSEENPGSIVEDAFNNAQNNGIVNVASAGNEYWSPVSYPATYDSVIAVSATDNNNNLATFSNVGSSVELAAPGVSIYSTIPGGGFASYNGTSMASPHVAGTAALIIGSGVTDPLMVRQIMDESALDLGSSGRDSLYGFGLVDARKSVEKAIGSEIVQITLNCENASLNKGDLVSLELSYLPTDASVDSPILWSSNNPSVVSVDNYGNIMAIANGEATITATSIFGSSSSCSVTVGANNAFSYSIIGEEAMITGYNGDATIISAPSSISGYQVSEIGSLAFSYYGYSSNYDNMTEIILPDGLKAIDSMAFYNSYSLEKVNLPDSVSELGYLSFYSCKSLETISLPRSLDLSSNADVSNIFEGCVQLSDVYVPSNVELLPGIFINSPDLTIHGYENSYAEDFAKNYSYIFASLGATATSIEIIDGAALDLYNRCLYLEVGESYDLRYVLNLETNDTPYFELNTEGYAKIDESGTITAIATPEGSVDVSMVLTASIGKVSENLQIIVLDNIYYSGQLSYDGTDVYLNPGVDNIETSIELITDSGVIEQVFPIVWASSDEKGCTIETYDYGNSSSANLKFSEPGEYEVTAQTGNGNTYLVSFNVEIVDYTAIYTIRSKNSNLVMDVNAGGDNAGDRIIQWEGNGGINQKWYLDELQPHSVTYVGDDITTEDFSEYMVGELIEKPQNPTYPYQNIIFDGWYKDPGFENLWDFDTDTMPNADLTLYAKWSHSYNGVYSIKSKNSGLVMDVYAGGDNAGDRIIQWEANGGTN